MYNWFESSVSFEKMLENGEQKKVTEKYLVDAFSFTEAEARTIAELRPYIFGEFTVSALRRARIAELFFNENGDKFFKAKVNFVTLDEKRGVEKKTPVTMMSQASDIEDARKVVIKGMEGTLANYEIESLTETKIMDVFPYNEEKKQSNN